MIAARCSCGGLWIDAHFFRPTQATAAVEQMVRHWREGHRVSCAPAFRSVVATTATVLAVKVAAGQVRL